MAIQETRTLPAPFIEGLGQDYAKELKARYQTRVPVESFLKETKERKRIKKQRVKKVMTHYDKLKRIHNE